MMTNKLVLNDKMTEVMHIHSRFRDTELLTEMRIGSAQITPNATVRNLGFHMDDTATYSSQVTVICKAAHFALYRISRNLSMLIDFWY